LLKRLERLLHSSLKKQPTSNAAVFHAPPRKRIVSIERAPI
jgi:hypothetical protein